VVWKGYEENSYQRMHSKDNYGIRWRFTKSGAEIAIIKQMQLATS
jgi:hypothetical protein